MDNNLPAVTRQALTELLTGLTLSCSRCRNDATCIGEYEYCDGIDSPACDDCCGHGCEDGHCESVERYLLKKLESAYRQGAREAQQEKADLERLNHKWLIDYGMLAKSKEAENVQARAEGAREAIEQCKKIVDDAFYENPHQAMELNKEIIAAFENYRKELDK